MFRCGGWWSAAVSRGCAAAGAASTVEQIVDPVPLVPLLHDVVPQMAEQLVEVPTEPGYALAVVAVQTLGWREARALLEQLAARPGRDTNTGRRDGGSPSSSSWRCLSFISSTLWWVSLLHRDRAHSANCAEDRMLARCSSWIGTRPSLCNDGPDSSVWRCRRCSSCQVVDVPAVMQDVPEFPAKLGGATASVHRQGVAVKGF